MSWGHHHLRKHPYNVFFYFSSTVSHFDRLASHVRSIICCVFVAPRFGGFATCRSNQQIRNLGFLQQSHFKCWSHHKSDGFWFGRICVSGHRCCIWCNCRIAWKGESVRPTDPDGSLTLWLEIRLAFVASSWSECCQILHVAFSCWNDHCIIPKKHWIIIDIYRWYNI